MKENEKRRPLIEHSISRVVAFPIQNEMEWLTFFVILCEIVHLNTQIKVLEDKT